MIIKLPTSLRYPVTITKLLRHPDENVERHAPLLTYSYETTVTEYPEFGVEVRAKRELTEQFDAPVVGRMVRWMVAVGNVVESSSVGICELEEPCSHEVQFSGLCAMCGQDMTMVDYSMHERTMLHMSHDSTGLTVSENEARKVEEEAKRRLLKQKKLSLVVDLDQTIIHATVDPTVAEWKNDPYCINYNSVKDVQGFKLDEDISGGRGTWYYVKMRPGLKEFLERISQLFELHIYTMGTRSYALAVKNIVDPDGTIFGERVLSRDESGSMTHKNLQRLFPVDTKMVVIIDDRGDVWSWCDNLVRVRPYDFFVGIGDINSMFLPKKQEFPTVSPEAAIAAQTPKTKEDVPEKKEEEEDGLGEEAVPQNLDADGNAIPPTQLSTLEKMVTMSGGADRKVISEQTEELEKVIEAQKEDRPLARKQEIQDKIDEKAAELAALTENGDGVKDISSDGGTQKHSVLQDNDYELVSLEDHLTAVHHQFYEEYEKNRGANKGRVHQLKKRPGGARKEDPDGLDLNSVPDVADIMPEMKQKTLSGVVVVFSGVIPLGADIHRSDIGMWAKSFGAHVVEKITSRVTHLIAARSRTIKVRQAARFPHINIVNLNWLYDSISHWKHQDEEPYLLTIHPDDRKANDDLGTLSSDNDSSPEDYDSEFPQNGDGEDKDTSLNMGNIGWKEVDEEFDAFFGDEIESDAESVRSERTEIELTKRKRDPQDPPTPTSQPAEDIDLDGDEASHLVKRQKLARERAGSLLKSVEVVEVAEDADSDDDNDFKYDAGADTDDDELARELDLELMAEEDETLKDEDEL
ncbi:hypothetical protein EDC01DRAFT_639501 [Geopyxis carbonaria]|nr:hypothetical protein EDC01DRAFT_639501 [Geopyxis carbonaria]